MKRVFATIVILAALAAGAQEWRGLTVLGKRVHVTGTPDFRIRVPVAGGSTSAPAPASLYASNSCICYLPFNATSPSNDFSVKGSNSFINGAGARAASFMNNALYGVDDQGVVTNSIISDASDIVVGRMYRTTISCWFKPTILPPLTDTLWAFSSVHKLVVWNTTNLLSCFWRSYWDGGNESPANSSYMIFGPWNTSQWYHVCIVWKGNYTNLVNGRAEYKYYTNGILAVSKTGVAVTNQWVAQWNAAGPMLLNESGETRYWTGYMDDFAVWRAVLTSNEIWSLYTQGPSSNTYSP